MKTRFNPLFFLMLLATAVFAPTSIAVTFTVDTQADDVSAHDASPGDGVCADTFGLGQCPLRAAIEETNALAGSDTIAFGVAGIIAVAASEGALPTVTGQLTITGTTAPGYAGPSVHLEDAPPTIYIDGANVGGAAGSANGLKFLNSGASASHVFAIGIIRFGTGINISTNVHNALVDSCYIGLLGDGSAAGNGQGIFIGEDGNVIGRVADGLYGNVISGNVDAGIAIGIASDNLIGGNRIGTSPEGIGARGNGTGIIVLANGNRIGLFDAGHSYGNVIAGNSGGGIAILGSDNEIYANSIGIAANGAARSNGGIGIKVQGANNFIGSTDANGENEVANNTDGIVVNGADNAVTGNHIGVTTFSQGNSGDGIRIDAGAGNIITANQILNNSGYGIHTLGDDTTIQNNQIGWLDFAVGGVMEFGNGGAGIYLQSSNNAVTANNVGFCGSAGVVLLGDGNAISGNFIGATSEGENVANASDGVGIYGSSTDNDVVGNTIAFNYAGIYLAPGTGIGNALYFNSIFSNRDFGIDLLGDHATPNDPGDPDTGPNKLQNFPVIVALTFDGVASPPEVTVEWTIDSTTANSTYPIYADFYLADSAASGQGKTIVGNDIASTPVISNLFTLTLPPGTTGGNLVATATDGNGFGSTSEFSPPIAFGISDTIFKNGFETP